MGLSGAIFTLGLRRTYGNAALHKEDNVLSQVQDAVEAETVTTVGKGMTVEFEPLTSEALLAVILTSLEEDKADDVVQVSLQGKSSMADYMVIASGRSSRQLAAMSEHLVSKLKQDHGRQSKVEGKAAGDWVLIDTGDIIVHIFRPEVREFYQLDKMWLSPTEAFSAPE